MSTGRDIPIAIKDFMAVATVILITFAFSYWLGRDVGYAKGTNAERQRAVDAGVAEYTPATTLPESFKYKEK